MEKQKVQQKERVVTQSTRFNVNGCFLYAEISDTMEGFAFRIARREDEDDIRVGDWQSHYQSFAELSYGNREFRMCSCYWDGTFQGEKPFEMIY